MATQGSFLSVLLFCSLVSISVSLDSGLPSCSGTRTSNCGRIAAGTSSDQAHQLAHGGRSRRSTPEAAAISLIGSLTNLTRALGVNSRRGCVSVYDGLFANCTSYAGDLLNELFVLPFGKALDAYNTIATQVCPYSCRPLLCDHLTSTLLAGVSPAMKANIAAAASSLVANILCPSSTSNSPTGTNQAAFTQLRDVRGLLLQLNAAVPLELIQNFSSCFTTHSVKGKILFSQLSVLFDEVAKLRSTTTGLLPLLTDSSSPSSSLRIVMAELPRRLDDTLRNMSLSRLAVSFNETYVTEAVSFLLCSSLFPTSNPGNRFLPCPWLCQNISGLLELRELFRAENQDTSSSGSVIVGLFEFLSRQCSEYGMWTYCLDRSCDNTNQLCRNGTAEAASARHAGEGPCFKPACPFPLHNTSNSKHWYSDAQEVLRAGYHAAYLLVDNTTQFNPHVLPCGLKCVTVTFTKDDEDTVRIIIGVFGWILFVFSLFAILTFYLNRVRINKYPTKVLLFLNVTSAIGNFANLIQFFMDKNDYSCNEDGTLRQGEPRSGTGSGGRLCTFLFIVIFYNLLASLCWWLALTHAWYVTFDRLDMKGGHPEDNNYFMKYYHMIAWSVPAIFTIVMVSNNYIDGFPLYGICYTTNVDAWFNFLSIPIVVAGVLGLPFLMKGIKQLLTYRRSMKRMTTFRRRPSEVKLRSDSSLRNFMMKLAFIIVMSFINLQVQFAVGLFMKVKWKSWHDMSEEHLLCVLTACTSDTSHCPSLPHPSLIPFVLTPLAIMMEGIVLCLWAFTHETWHAWHEASKRPSEFFKRASQLALQRQATTNSILTSNSVSSGGAHRGSVSWRHQSINGEDSRVSYNQGASRCTGIDFVEGANAQSGSKRRKRIQKMSSVDFNARYGVSKEESDAAKKTIFADANNVSEESEHLVKSASADQIQILTLDESPKMSRQPSAIMVAAGSDSNTVFADTSSDNGEVKRLVTSTSVDQIQLLTLDGSPKLSQRSSAVLAAAHSVTNMVTHLERSPGAQVRGQYHSIDTAESSSTAVKDTDMSRALLLMNLSDRKKMTGEDSYKSQKMASLSSTSSKAEILPATSARPQAADSTRQHLPNRQPSPYISETADSPYHTPIKADKLVDNVPNTSSGFSETLI